MWARTSSSSASAPSSATARRTASRAEMSPAVVAVSGVSVASVSVRASVCDSAKSLVMGFPSNATILIAARRNSIKKDGNERQKKNQVNDLSTLF